MGNVPVYSSSAHAPPNPKPLSPPPSRDNPWAFFLVNVTSSAVFHSGLCYIKLSVGMIIMFKPS